MSQIHNSIQKYNHLKWSFFSLVFCALFFISSCSDNGCIDADDFGEYESEVVKVEANHGQNNCEYDRSQPLTSAPGSLINCFTKGNVSVSDETGSVFTNDETGCSGFQVAKIRNLCLDQCIRDCNLKSLNQPNNTSPNWTSTSKKLKNINSGVTISPQSTIEVRATGNISLGSSGANNSFFVQSDNPFPHAKNSDWQNKIYDVEPGTSAMFLAGGRWQSDDAGNITSFGAGNDLDSPMTEQKQIEAINAINRLALFVIPHPDGYDFDISENDEKLGSKGIPLIPDVGAWRCFSPDNEALTADCSNDISYYTSVNGYKTDAIKESLLNSIFPFTAEEKTTMLGIYGGMIRWAGDNLVPASYDPFTNNSVSCDENALCANKDRFDESFGIVSENMEMINSSTDARKYYFRSLAPATECNDVELQIAVLDGANNNAVPFYTGNESDTRIIVTIPANNEWATATITLEPSHRLNIAPISDQTSTGADCAKVIGYKYSKYHDINIYNSGFVSFTNITGIAGTGSTCKFNGRIVNPQGSIYKQSFTEEGVELESDYYEYSEAENPFKNIIVSDGGNRNSNWSKRIFVRKGQILRFDPESWNGTIPLDGVVKQCGITTAMRIESRPALLCRGVEAKIISNPDCRNVLYNTTTFEPERCNDNPVLLSECNDSSSNAYCVNQDCQGTITCSDTMVGSQKVITCSVNTPDIFTCPIGDERTKCGICDGIRKQQAEIPLEKVVQGIDVCYDLENYRGKVSNIKISDSNIIGFNGDHINNSNITKGANLLGSFNGQYGTINPSTDTRSASKSSNGMRMTQSSTPTTFSIPSRLKFLILDGDNFLDATPNNASPAVAAEYQNNSASGALFNGTNGIEIATLSTLEFSNGQYLKARICKEEEGTYVCSNDNPTALAGAPKIIDYNMSGTGVDQVPQKDTSSLYSFDDSGYLFREANATTIDCNVGDDGITTAIGQRYYCHHYKDDDQSKLRLTFQIFDPEVPDCIIPMPSGKESSENDGVLVNNPNYANEDADGDGNNDNQGLTCTYADLQGGTDSPCKKEKLCVNKYANNYGEYYVHVKVKKNDKSRTASSFISSIITPLIEILDGIPEGVEGGPKVGQAERTYKAIIMNPRFQSLVTMCITVMFTFYGLGYLMGVSNLNHQELMNRILKIALIGLFTGETGWYWFNHIVVNFFKNGTDYVSFAMATAFDDSPEIIAAIDNENFYDKSVLFSGVDNVMTLIFSDIVLKKVSALLFASIFGWAYLLIIFYGFIAYVYAVANAVLMYITAQLFMSILFTLGPIFFLFTLFGQTKEMFDNWLKAIIGFSLQQIFILVTLAFFNMLMYEIIKMSLGFKICWDAVWVIHIITNITLLEFWTVASLPPNANAHSQVGNFGNPEGIPSIFTILLIWVVASLMQTFVTFMCGVATAIGGGISASSLSSGIAGMASQIASKIPEAPGALFEAATGEKLDLAGRLDEKLFNSGDRADKARERKEKENAANMAHIGGMKDAGREAMDNLKKTGKYINASKEDQKKMLNETYQKAAKDYGKKKGLSDDHIDKLMKGEGVNKLDANTNVIGFLKDMAAEKVTSGFAVHSLEDDAAKESNETFLKEADALEAMENMSDKERENFLKRVEDNDIKVLDRRDRVGNYFKTAHTNAENVKENLKEKDKEIKKKKEEETAAKNPKTEQAGQSAKQAEEPQEPDSGDDDDDDGSITLTIPDLDVEMDDDDAPVQVEDEDGVNSFTMEIPDSDVESDFGDDPASVEDREGGFTETSFPIPDDDRKS